MVVLTGLCRCFKVTNNITLVVCIVCVISCFVLSRRFYVTAYDIYMLIIPFMVFLHKYKGYPWGPCLYFLLAWLSFYTFREVVSIEAALKTIGIFSVVNLVLNLINIVSSDLYMRIASLFLKTQAFNDMCYYFSRFKYMSGLSDHFSRNAFFCVAGGSVFFALFYSKPHKRILFFLGTIVEMGMIMVIGKRGHFLFATAALLITYVLMAPKISKKIMNFARISIGSLIILGFLIEFVPKSSFVFERFLSQQMRGDISAGRFYLWSLALDAFRKKPVLGWGYGYFNSTFWNDSLSIYYPGVHNDYLQWLCEQGIVGFVINIVAMICFFKLSVDELRCIASPNSHASSDSKMLIIWSVFFQTFVILYSLTGLPHFDYEINIIYYMSIAVPLVLLADPACHDLNIRRKLVKW